MVNGVTDRKQGTRTPLPPKAEPVFSTDSITMLRRMRFNPLRLLDPENLSMSLDQFDTGILGPAALLWDAMCRRDDTLSFVKPQLENAIAAKPWGVFKKKNADPKEAARHAAALEYFYGNVTAVDAFDRNERGGLHLLLRQMGSAFSYRYAVHHFVWRPSPGKMIEVQGAAPVPALTAELEHVPLWYFENTTGTLRFLPMGGYGVQGQELNWKGEWMVSTGVGIMFAAAICYVFKRLTFQDWTIFNERYAQNKVVGMTNAQRDTEQGRAMANMVANFNSDQGIVLYETQPTDKPPISLLGPQGTTSVDIFERFLDRQDRKMTVMFRGSDLRNMSREKDTVGVSAQSEETEALEIAHCARLADACRTFIDRYVIQYCFGEGVEPLAHFGLPDMEREDAQQLRESAGFLADRGALVEMDTVAERLGVTLTENPEEALGAAGGKNGTDTTDETDGADTRTENAKLRRLRVLVEEAVRTGNAKNQRRIPKGQPGAGRWVKDEVPDAMALGETVTRARTMLAEDLQAAGIDSDPDVDRVCAKLQERLRVKNPVAVAAKLTEIRGEALSNEQRRMILDHTQAVFDMLPPRVAKGLPHFSVRVINDEKQQFAGLYRPDRKELVINLAHGGYNKATIFHEMGHYIHLHGPKTYQAAIREHFQRRTANEPMQSGAAGFDFSFKRDHFTSDYAGRIYPGEPPAGQGIELPSVHLEHLATGGAGYYPKNFVINSDKYRETMSVALSIFYYGRRRK